MFNFGKILDEGRKEYLAKYGAEDGVKPVVDKFWRIRSRAKSPENDIDWWIKKPFADLKKFVDGFDTRKRSVRRSDEHSRKAEKFGAKLMGERDGYEIWYVPSYKAAVELGRFYRNVSVKWCISTDNREYFTSMYRDSEFMFLIWTGTGRCPVENCEKLAVQIGSDFDFLVDEHPDYKLWDITDNDIQYDDEFLESSLRETVDYAVSLFNEIPYNRAGWAKKAAESFATDAEWLEKNIFRRHGERDDWDIAFVMSADGTVTAKYKVSDLTYVISDSGVPYSWCRAALTYDLDKDIFRNVDEADYDLPASVVADFNRTMKPYGISWDAVQDVAQDLDANVGSKAYAAISEMLDDDFAAGNSYFACYADAAEVGTIAEAREDILSQLNAVGVRSCQYDDERQRYVLVCEYSKDRAKQLVNEYMSSGARDHVFNLACAADSDRESEMLMIAEPQYGWSGLDEKMMKEYVDEFAKSLIGRLTVRRDAPGQMHFGFDRDYVDNPKNMPRR